MPKAVRKNIFSWSAQDLERVLALLLDNMKFQDIKIQSVENLATARAVDRASMGQYLVDFSLEFAIKWSQQAEGLTTILSIEENRNEWTGCLCNRLADSISGALKTACEMEHQ